MKTDSNYLHGYNKSLQPFANKLRKEMTKAEVCLWKYILRGRMMKGYQFRRQRPVQNYIVDFICMDLKLIIEVDGITHQFEEVYRKDLRRQAKLEEDGYCIIRFNDDEILNNMNQVSESILFVVEEIEKRK